MRRYKRLIFVYLMALSFFLSALENSVTVLMPNRNTFVDSTVEISILVVGNQIQVEPKFPKFDGATLSFVKVNKIANLDTFSHLFQYVMHFNKPGDILIPSVTATVDGHMVSSKPINLTVEDVNESDEVTLTVSYSKSEVYVGEPLLVTVQIQTNTPASLLKAMDITLPVFKDSRFQSLDKRIGVTKQDEIGLPVNRTRVIADVKQEAIKVSNKEKVTRSTFTFYKILIPLEVGDLILSPSRIIYSRAKVTKKNRRNYQWNRYPSYFSNNLFLNTSASDKYSRFKFTTNEFRLKVKPLPQLNKPASFNGIVTPFKVSITTNTKEVRVGDPISLTLVVEDALFLESFELTKLDTLLELTKNFSVSKQRSIAKLDVDRNVKVFHQTIRPLKVGIREIPALRFSYFSPIDHKYHYAETKPMAISVKANEDFSGFDVKFSDGSAIKNSLKESAAGLYFNYADAAIAKNHPFTKAMNSKWLFWVILLIPFLVKGLFELFKATKLYRGTHHYISSSSYRKFRRTPVKTESQLHKAISLYFSRRMHVEPKSLTFWDVEQLVDHQVDLTALRKFWDHLDQDKFSGKRADRNIDPQCVKSIRKVIRMVEKILPITILLFVFYFTSFGLHATTATTLFDRAGKVSIKNYESGKSHYLVSAEKYLIEAKAFDASISKGRLYYNAANAFFLADDLGHAMLYYLKAEQLIPNNHHLFMNRRFVESERIDDIQPKTSSQFFITVFYLHYHLAPMTRFWCFVISYLTLISFLVYKKQRYFVKGFRLFFLICSVLFGSSIIIDQLEVGRSQGVIVAREVTAFKGPGALYEAAFLTSLHAGTTFRQLGTKGAWVWIELEDGKQCWVSKKALAFI